MIAAVIAQYLGTAALMGGVGRAAWAFHQQFKDLEPKPDIEDARKALAEWTPPATYPHGFEPTAFWFFPDFDEKPLRDGGEAFWMRAPLPQHQVDAKVPPSQGGSGKPALFGKTRMQSAPLMVPYHPTTTMRMTQGEAQHGWCPDADCNDYCRIVEIDGGRYYTCSNRKCKKSHEAWGAGNKSFVLVHNPLAWIERKFARRERGHWFRKDAPCGRDDCHTGGCNLEGCPNGEYFWNR